MCAHSSLGIPESEREAKRALMIQQLSAEEIKGMRVAGRVGSLRLLKFDWSTHLVYVDVARKSTENLFNYILQLS